MPTVTVDKAKNNFDALFMSVQNSFEPLRIAGDNCAAVIVSEEVWRSLEETLFLTSLSGVNNHRQRRWLKCWSL